MSGSIYLIRHQGALVPLSEQPYDSEALLQQLLAEHPALLAGEQMVDGSPRRWLLVAREVTVSADDGLAPWYVDHLFLDQDCVPTLVEVKRSSDTRIRREVVGQMLDYAANAVSGWSVDQLRTRFGSEPEAKERFQLFLNGGDPEQFWDTVAANLAGGRIRMVFVADEIPPELRRIVDFLAAQLRNAEIFAVEVRQFQGSGERALVPRLVSTPKSTPGAAGLRQWDEQSFFRELASRRPECAEVARQLFDWVRRNMSNFWYGTAGACIPSLVLPTGKLLLFAMRTNGTIELQLQHMRMAPFAEGECRLELIRRLNGIPGIAIPDDAVTRRPSFDMSVLTAEPARAQFVKVMEWAIDLVRSASAGAVSAGSW